MFAGQQVSSVEAAAFATGLLSVWLAQRVHVATWPTGIASVLCFAWLFLQAKLYADASLQLAFCAVSVYGWVCWRRSGGGEKLRIGHAPLRAQIAGSGAAAAATAACAWLLRTQTDSPAPWVDAAILAFSLLATWQQARGWVESWWIWIGVDIVSIPLYWSRSLPLTTLLYAIFLGLCLRGLRTWHRRLAAQEAA